MSDSPFSRELSERIKAAMENAIVHRMYFQEFVTPPPNGDEPLTRDEATKLTAAYIQATSIKLQVNEPPEEKEGWE